MKAHVSCAAWQLVVCLLDAPREERGRLYPHKRILLRRWPCAGSPGRRCGEIFLRVLVPNRYRLAEQKAADCFYHFLHLQFVYRFYPRQVQLRELLPVNIGWPWISNVLDDPLKVGCFFIRRNAYRVAAQTAAHCRYQQLNGFHLPRIHSLQVYLRERLPVNILWPWIGDVLDDPR